MSNKQSFFEKLTGAVRLNSVEKEETTITKKNNSKNNNVDSWLDEETDKDAELTVDVYQDSDMIVVKTMIAGVRPEDLDVTIARDSVTIRGKREAERIENDDDYFVRELYWGSFSRTIQLPEEINVDEAEAVERHGLLILKLPKLDRKRQSKLKVKTV